MTPQVIGERFLQGTSFRELVGHVLGATEEEREQTMERMLRQWAEAQERRGQDAYTGWESGHAKGHDEGFRDGFATGVAAASDVDTVAARVCELVAARMAHREGAEWTEEDGESLRKEIAERLHAGGDD